MNEGLPPAPLGPSLRTVLPLALVVFLCLFGRNMTRALDSDEQLFVAPPALVHQEGLTPYIDFPYFHMPNLLLVYAWVIGWSPYKLLTARLLSTLCGTGTVLLVFAAGWRLLAGLAARHRWLLAGGLTLVFVCCRFFTYTSGLAWNHDTSVLATLGAYFLCLRGLRVNSLRCLAGAGLLLGAAVGIRLSFALCFLPFTLVVCFAPSALSLPRRLAGVGLAALAAAGGLLPALVLMARAPDRFLCCNLGYYHYYTLACHIHDQAAWALLVKAGMTVWRFGYDPANLFLLAVFLSAAGWLAWRPAVWRTEHRRPLLLLAGLLPALFVGVLGPTPQQIQYNYVLLPFMLLTVFHALALRHAAGSNLRGWKLATAAAVLIFAGIGLPRWYWGVLYLPFPERWETVVQHRIGQWVRAHSPPDARVLTLAPIAPLEAGMKVYPQHAVGYFVALVAPLQSADERRRYGTATADESVDALAARPPDVVLHTTDLGLDTPFIRYAQAHGFLQVEPPDARYQMWVRPTKAE